MREVEVPDPGPGEVLLRSTLSAISHGTEMNVYRGRAPHWSLVHDRERRLFVQGEQACWTYPLAYGYARVGVVESAGEGVAPELRGRRAFCYRPHQSYHHALCYALMAPCVMLVLGFLLYSMIDEIYLGLTRWSLLTTPSSIFVGLSPYGQPFADGVFWASLGRSCIWTAGTLVVELVIGLPLALALKHRTRLTGLATGLVLLPLVTPTVVVSYAWTWILDSQFGIFDAVLRAVHLVGSVSPLASYGSALPTVTFVSGWKGTPFMAIMLLATLKSILAEVYEAVQVDGAGFLRRHLHITLPA